MPTVAADRLLVFTRRVISAMGCGPEEAEEVADHLVRANLAGHDSHGVGMIPGYVELRAKGLLVANQTLRPVLDATALLVLDAGRGFGQRMGAEAVRMAIGRARGAGACVLALKNSSHLGRIGTYGELAAAEGMAFVGFVNVGDHQPFQAPYGCGDARLGTNPFCAAVPGPKGEGDLVLDMATSTIAFGKARVARNKGVPVPEGALIDRHGRPTTDPHDLVDDRLGALLAFGGHKGSGLAVMCEMLGGALIGAQTIVHDKKGGVVNSMLAILVDGGRFGGAAEAGREIGAVRDWIKAAPPAPGFTEVLLPGEPERRSTAQRRAQGIPIDEKSYTDILAAAARLGVDGAELERGHAG